MNAVFAQVKFTAICPQKTIGKDELLQVRFQIDNATHVESITPPDFRNFSVVSGPNQQRGMSNINGVINEYIAIGFTLQPLKPGTFKIGSATAVANGSKFTTQPITVKVTNETSSGGSGLGNATPFPNPGFTLPRAPGHGRLDDYILKPGESAEDKVKKNLFVKLAVSKNTCYVGEPVIASFKLYTRLRSETNITSAPSFNGFSVTDLDVDQNVSTEIMNGREYNVYVLRKVQLYPMQPGDLSLDPLQSENRVTFLTSSYADQRHSDPLYDMFRDFADDLSPDGSVTEKTVSVKSDPVTIHVKPLPGENVPKDFKGAVGRYNISASIDKTSLTTDDAGSLKVIISGTGNIKLINAPGIHWPENIDGYDAKVKEQIDKSVVPVRGIKTFTFPFTVSNAGNYVIDSISFSYFDPETSTYKTIKTPSVALEVKQGQKKPVPSSVKSADMPKKQTGSTFTTELITGVVLLIGVFFLFLKWRNNRDRNKEILEKNVAIDNIKSRHQEPEFVIPGNPLLKVHEKLKEGNSAGFFRELDHSLKIYLAAKFRIPAEEISKKTVNEEIDKCNVGLGTSLMLNSLMEEIEQNLYSVAGPQQLQNVFEKASQVISLLDKQCGS